MTTTHRSKLSAFSMLFGMAVSVLLCVLTRGGAKAGMLVDVDPETRVEEEKRLIKDDVAARPARSREETATIAHDVVTGDSFFDREPGSAS